MRAGRWVRDIRVYCPVAPATLAALLTDPHSPGPVRAYVPLVNNDAFEAAWGVKPGDKMYRAPEERVRIW